MQCGNKELFEFTIKLDIKIDAKTNTDGRNEEVIEGKENNTETGLEISKMGILFVKSISRKKYCGFFLFYS